MPSTNKHEIIDKDFKDFLIEHDAYENYIVNKNDSCTGMSLLDAFHWDSSTEGNDYWYSLHALWTGLLQPNDTTPSVPTDDLVSYPVPSNEKDRTPFATYIYELSQRLGHDGFTLLQSERYEVTESAMAYHQDYVGKELTNSSDYEVSCLRNLPSGWNNLTRIILDDIKVANVHYDLRYVTPFIKILGTNAKLNFDEGTIQIGKENPQQLTIKAFGRKFGFVKWSSWSKIAERIKHELTVASRIKYFTDYESLSAYYRNSDCSGDSCMRYDFDELPLHPCAVYAHDIEAYNMKGGSNIHKYVSSGIKLAVLFDEDGVPEARCMINTDAKVRGKAFGSGASTLTKVLGYSEGMEGSINIIETVDNNFLMPYVDGVDVVDEDTGKLGEGTLSCDNTRGLTNVGVWSIYEEEYLNEDDAVWSRYLDSYISESEATHTVEDDFIPFEHCELLHTANGDSFIEGNRDYLYLGCIDEWVYEDDAEELLFEYIAGNANLSELIDFSETL